MALGLAVAGGVLVLWFWSALRTVRRLLEDARSAARQIQMYTDQIASLKESADAADALVVAERRCAAVIGVRNAAVARARTALGPFPMALVGRILGAQAVLDTVSAE